MSGVITQKGILKPCPFCAGVAEVATDGESFYVRCRDCKIRTESALQWEHPPGEHKAFIRVNKSGSIREVIELWNKRTVTSGGLLSYVPHSSYIKLIKAPRDEGMDMIIRKRREK